MCIPYYLHYCLVDAYFKNNKSSGQCRLYLRSRVYEYEKSSTSMSTQTFDKPGARLLLAPVRYMGQSRYWLPFMSNKENVHRKYTQCIDYVIKINIFLYCVLLACIIYYNLGSFQSHSSFFSRVKNCQVLHLVQPQVLFFYCVNYSLFSYSKSQRNYRF